MVTSVSHMTTKVLIFSFKELNFFFVGFLDDFYMHMRLSTHWEEEM